jgi:GNAT superfamily N-acetyltransferase
MILRKLRDDEAELLKDFLYEAIYLLEGVEPPSFAISLYKEYRGKGIGTSMMRRMLELLKEQGYKRASLAVQKENYAVRMYEAVGFRTVDENVEEYIMVCDL